MTSLMPLPLVRKVDHMLLDPQLSRGDIEAGCAVAVRCDCYAVLVKPHYIESARKLLKETPVKVFSVVGFPHGGVTTATKMFETQDLLQRGADEIEMVANLGALRDHEDLTVRNDITSVVKVARGHPITVIFECCFLTPEEIERGCEIARVAGASFLKAGTGFAASATADQIKLIKTAQPQLPVKAGGNFDTEQAALEAIEAGAIRIATNRTEKMA